MCEFCTPYLGIYLLVRGFDLMKRNIILGVFLLSIVYVGIAFMGQVSAQKETDENGVISPDVVLLTENFSYTAGQLTTVSSGNWVNFSGTGNFIPVSSPGLTYPGYAGSGTGNKIDIVSASTSAEDVYRQFATQTTGTTYAAFLVNVANTTGLLDNTTTTGDYFAGLLPSSSTTALNARVSIRLGTTPNTYQLGLRATSSNATTTFAATDLAVGTTHLVIISNELVTGNANDPVNMWINPTLGGAQPAATVSQVTATATDNADIARFFVRQGTTTTPNASIDGVIVGTAWADVAGTTGGATPTPTPTPTPTATPTATPTPTGTPAGPPRFLFTTRLDNLQEVPTNASAGRGFGRVVLNAAETEITASVYWEGLTSGTTAGHIHTPGGPGVNAPVRFNLNPATGVTRGSVVNAVFAITPAEVLSLRAGTMYFNIHTTNFPGGEIRGQIVNTVNDAPLDFNGDGRTDFGVVRTTAGNGGTQTRWFNLTNATPQVESQFDFGVNSDSLAPGDYDGDGRDDVAVWRQQTGNSTFYILQSSTNTVRTVRFGLPGDNLVVNDYDGDGVDDPAIFRRGDVEGGQAFFWWFGSFGITRNVQVVVPWGLGGVDTGDNAIPGDFNGDGRADFCVIRNSAAPTPRGLYFIHFGTGLFDASSPNDQQIRFGFSIDTAVPGDYDGDGITDIAITRPEGAALAWYYRPSSAPTTFRRTAWGRQSTDVQVQGDYDGDGITDQAVWRSTSGNPSTYFILRSRDQVVQYQNWGLFGDAPSAQDTYNE